MFRLAVPLLLAVLATGCGSPVAADPAPAAPPVATAAVRTAPPEPVAEVTPAAQAAFYKIARDAGVKPPYFMRLRVVPGSCQGMQYKLDLDPEPIAKTDRAVTCDRVTVVYQADQYPLIQGAKIDHVTEKDGQTGFKVETPNKSAANKKQTADWIQAEIDKVSKAAGK